MSMRASQSQQSKTAVRLVAKEFVEDKMTPTMLQEMTERGPVTGAMETLRRTLSAAPSRPEQFRRVMGEVAEPLTRQADLTRLLQQTEQLRMLNPEIERAAEMYRRMLRGGTQAAIDTSHQQGARWRRKGGGSWQVADNGSRYGAGSAKGNDPR